MTDPKREAFEKWCSDNSIPIRKRLASGEYFGVTVLFADCFQAAIAYRDAELAALLDKQEVRKIMLSKGVHCDQCIDIMRDVIKEQQNG
jgi:hypothetical protein